MDNLDEILAHETASFIDDVIAFEGAHAIKKVIGKDGLKDLKKNANELINSLLGLLVYAMQFGHRIDHHCGKMRIGKFDKKLTKSEINERKDELDKLCNDCMKKLNDFDKLVKKHEIDDGQLKSLFKQNTVDTCGVYFEMLNSCIRSHEGSIQRLHLLNHRYKVPHYVEEVNELQEAFNFFKEKIYHPSIVAMQSVFKRSHLVAYVSDNGVNANTLLFGAYAMKKITFG